MPILLTTPINSGDLDPAAPDHEYTEAKIISFTADIKNKALTLNVEYGNTVTGTWVSGLFPKICVRIVNIPEIITEEGTIPADPQYDEIVATLPTSLVVPLYDAVSTNLYQWLLDNDVLVGTIV